MANKGNPKHIAKKESVIPCSVGILTFNNEATISRALKSVRACDDIIICDGGSTDDTLRIAESYGATILRQDAVFKFPNNTIKNYAGVRNQTLKVARHNWFLFIDSDEYISKELENEIRRYAEDEGITPAAFWVPRKYVLGGQIIECASTYPNKQMRFFHMDAVTHFIKNVHERIEIKKNAAVGVLSSYMYVPMEVDLSRLRVKWAYYAELEIRHLEIVTPWFILGSVVQSIKLSLLFTYRYVRNLFFCKGSRLPYAYEWLRHVYHIQLIRAQIRKMLRGNKKKKI